jgi:hypothetical protein
MFKATTKYSRAQANHNPTASSVLSVLVQSYHKIFKSTSKSQQKNATLVEAIEAQLKKLL